MKKLILLALAVQFLTDSATAQGATNRVRFRYRISPAKLAYLNSKGIQITDATGTTNYSLCGTTKLKCLVNLSNGVLNIDPWSISSQQCNGRAGIINAASPNSLRIDLNRALVGNPTKVVRLPYQTWILGFNVIGVKFRPTVHDFNGKEFGPNVISGNLNLGFSFGRSWGYTSFTHRSANSYSLTPSLALNLTSIALGKEVLKKNVDVSGSPNNFVLSPSLSLILARNDIGIIVSHGIDVMTGKNSSSWAYGGRGFWGLGLSAGFKL